MNFTDLNIEGIYTYADYSAIVGVFTNNPFA